MKVTINDVAQQAGVSKTTVSRIMNGNYGHTKQETKDRILQVIKEMDYRPNTLAKGLKSLKTNVIGIVLSNLKNPFWTTVLEGVEDTCKNSGYNLMICNSNEDSKLEEQYIREFRMRQVDGIVINPTVQNLALYQKMHSELYPMVVINRKIPDLNAHYVVMDNVKGASLAVQHLLNNGRKKVAIIIYRNPNVSTWNERVDGYRDALLRNGYSLDELRIVFVNEKPGITHQEIMNYLLANPDTDAIFSSNNMLTLEVIKAVKDLKLRTPDDIAIVGYDETVWSQHLNPPLTTIMQPGYEMGRIAAKILVNTVKSNRSIKSQHVVLEPQLIVRGSSGSMIT